MINNKDTANTDDNLIVGYMNSITGPRNSIPVLVFTEIPQDAITNLKREDIIDPLNATYETNKFKITKIIDEELNEYYVCTIDGEERKKNEEIVEEDLCFGFYLSKKRAISLTNKHNYTYTGPVLTYFENGQKEEEYTLNEKRKKHGKFTRWDFDTTLLIECNYLNGKLDGEYKKYEEGKLIKHVKYSNGTITEYLGYDLTKKKIDKIYNKTMEKYNSKISTINLNQPYKKNTKKQKYKETDNFSIVLENFSDTIVKLSTIKSLNDEIVLYNNLKKMDIIKKMCDTLNTPFGISYFNIHSEQKEVYSTDINEFIEQFDKKKEPQYQQFKLYLTNVKESVFV